MLVTIGLPVYNGEQYLEETLRTILDQTYTDFELLVADNASTDRTLEIVNRLAGDDPRVRVLGSGENRGTAWNYNRCLDEARGTLFRWIAYDDLLDPAVLAESVEFMTSAPPDVIGCYPPTVLIDQDSRDLGPYDERIDLSGDSPHQRLANLLDNLELANCQYALFRYEVLARSCRMGAYGEADRAMLADLVLRGRIVRHGTAAFRRRMHPQRSMEATASDPKALLAYYNPQSSAQRVYPHSRLFRGHLSVVARAPLPLTERVACLWELGLRWHRWRPMLREWREAARARIRLRHE